MAGGAVVNGANFVSTPSWILTILFLVFLAISLLIELILHFATKMLRQRKKNGLLAAVESIKSELLILGFISLLLTTLSSYIEARCVDIRTSWWIINTVSGEPCPSCLPETDGLTQCYLKYQQCPVENPLRRRTLLQSDALHGYPMDGSHIDPSMGGYYHGYYSNGYYNDMGYGDGKASGMASMGWRGAARELLAGGAASAVTSEVACNGPTPIRVGTCTDGQEPMLTYKTLEQVHILLFLLAMIHITTTICLILLAYARTRVWRRWQNKENVYKEIAANAVSNHQNMKSRHHSIRHMVARLRHQQQTDHDTPTEETNGRTNGGATTEMINRSAHADAQRELTAATAGGGAAAGTTAAGASASNTTSQKQPVRTDQHIPDDPDSAVDIEKGLGGGHTGQSTSAGPSGDAVEESPPSAFAMAFMRPGNEDPANGKTGNGKAQEGKTVSQEKTSFSNGKSLESKGSAAGARGLPKRSSGMALRRQDTLPAQLRVNNGLARKSMLQRKASFQDIKPHQLATEIAICFASQFVTNPIRQHDFHLMTASFIYTHKLNSSFDFVAYIEKSMEADYADMVGLTLGCWLYVILVIFFGGIGGWLASWLNLAFAASLTLLNTQLIYVIRYATRNAAVNKLNHKAFWFRRPELLLPWIRLVLFSASFEFSSQIFFAWEFGTGSCYFHNAGFRAYAAWPYWVDSLLAIGQFFVLGVLTLPLYALGVQMGSTHRHHLLPATVGSELLAWSKRAKKRVVKDMNTTARVAHYAKKQLGISKSLRSEASLTQASSTQATQPNDDNNNNNNNNNPPPVDAAPSLVGSLSVVRKEQEEKAARKKLSKHRLVRFSRSTHKAENLGAAAATATGAAVVGGVTAAAAAAGAVAVGGLGAAAVAAKLTNKPRDHAQEASEDAMEELRKAQSSAQDEEVQEEACSIEEEDEHTTCSSTTTDPEAGPSLQGGPWMMPEERPKPLVGQVLGLARTSLTLARSSANLARTSANLARNSIRSVRSAASGPSGAEEEDFEQSARVRKM